jgi:hypothetical protein
MITKANKTISNFFCGDVVLSQEFKSRVKSTAVGVMGGGKDELKKTILRMRSRRMPALKMVPLLDVLRLWSPSKHTTPEPQTISSVTSPFAR